MDTSEDTPSALSAADKEALDALVESGFDPAGVRPDLGDRAQRIASMLGLLEPAHDGVREAATRGDLIGRTLERTGGTTSFAAGQVGPAAIPFPGEIRLSEADASAIDDLVERGWSAEGAADGRSERVMTLLGALDADPLGVDPASKREERRRDLIERTLVAIQDSPGRGRLAPAVDPFGPGGGFRMRDAVVAAAAVLLMLVVAWPAVTSMRAETHRVACQANLRNAYVGLRTFASDFSGRLPHASLVASEQERQRRSLEHVGKPGYGQWWHVGDPMHSHSANLFATIVSGHAEMEHFACPGNPQAPTRLSSSDQLDWETAEQVSYSYQLFPSPRPIRIRFGLTSEGRPFPIAERIVLMANRSPVVDRVRRGEAFDPEARSVMHRGRGQNVLYNDGVVEFLRSPEMEDQDNLWIPASIERSGKSHLDGQERPVDETDAFVG